MTNDLFGAVPVLPVVVPMGIAIFVVLVWRLASCQLLDLPRVLVAAAIAAYAAGVVANTIFPIYLHHPSGDEPWVPAISWIPFHDYELADAVANVVVFLPLGVLVALLSNRPIWRMIVITVATTSLVIEACQLLSQPLFGGGHVADINDFIFNTLGGCAGFGVYLMLRRPPRLASIVDRFQWAEKQSPTASGRDQASTNFAEG